MLQISCIGHLGGDAEVKNANGKEFTTFRVAHTNKWTSDDGITHEEVTWVDCVMQGKPNVLQYLKRGQQIFCSGTMSLRVYSSKKDRCLKAGLTINVRSVELLGGKSDDIPSVLYNPIDNSEVRTQKWYNAVSLQRDETQPELIELVSRTGDKYRVDRNGWLTPVVETTE